MFNTILFPIDQSRESREAVDTVVNVVKTYSSRLVLLSVLENPNTEDTNSEANVMAKAEAVAELLSEAKALFASAQIETEILERSGIPSFVICDVAEEIEANLIIMGCRGLGLTNSGQKESVTNMVINLSPCPVLVVP